MIVSEMLTVAAITNAALLPRASLDALVLHDGFALCEVRRRVCGTTLSMAMDCVAGRVRVVLAQTFNGGVRGLLDDLV